MSTQQLIIIGAGPKAMAIAAKNTVLKEMGFATPELHIIEKTAVGAHWTGEGGFTNGRLALGTAPEKDVGFPYESHGYGKDVDEQINHRMRDFSWTNFLVGKHEYSDWVDRGRPAPEHRQWAQYLRWVYDKVKPHLTCTRGEMTHLTIEANQWKVTFNRPDGELRVLRGDGLVLTGPGKTRLPFALPTDDRVFTTESFWKQYELFRKAPRQRLALVGNGENAAAIAIALTQLGNEDLSIDILSPHGMTFSRGESFQENRVYSNAFHGHWHELTEEDRRQFIYRTDRGVFSQYAQKFLDQSQNVRVIPGRLTGVEVGSSGKLVVSRDYNNSVHHDQYSGVVVATGGDPIGFLTQFMDADVQKQFLNLAGLADFSQAGVERKIDESLAVRGLFPRLHLPMLSGVTQGPGFANLSCLGRLSDHILRPYTQAMVREPLPVSQSTTTWVFA